MMQDQNVLVFKHQNMHQYVMQSQKEAKSIFFGAITWTKNGFIC